MRCSGAMVSLCAMMSRYSYHGTTWIDLERPSEDELRRVARELSLSERFVDEALAPTPMPLVASEKGIVLLALHFPAPGDGDGEMREQEVDFIVGERFILTVRYEVIAPLHRLKKVLETQHIVSPRSDMTTGTLLEILFAHLYTAIREHGHASARTLASIEHDMFNDLERHTVRQISNVSRAFLHVEASLANQEEPLARFLKALSSRGPFDEAFAERAERILAERAQAARLAATYRAVATELRETNAALLEARQNEIMKTLTVITFGMLPLELIALVFSMHALGTPLEHDPNAFWVIMAIMAGIAGLMTLFFARKRWLS